MPTNVEDGLTELPDGSVLTWSREEVTPEAAELFRLQAAAGTHRVEALQELGDGIAAVRKFDVPGAGCRPSCSTGRTVAPARARSS